MESIVGSITNDGMAALTGSIFSETADFSECTCGFEARRGRKRGRRSYRRR